MIYLQITLLLFFILGPIAWVVRYVRRLKKDYLRRIIEKIVLKERNTLPTHMPYCSEVLLQTATWGTRLGKAKFLEFVSVLKQGKIMPIIRFLNKDNQKNLVSVLKSLVGQNKKALFYCHKKAVLAATLMREAKENLSEGDLLSASEKVSRASKLFNKLNYIYEEAETYLLMGTIYRVSGVFDAADFMLRTAQKIFIYLGASNKGAEATATLGMLMTAQKRFEEAQEYFTQAVDAYAKEEAFIGVAEIANQQALTFLLAGNFKQAFSQAEQALRQHKKLSNLQGQAFSLEIQAYCEKISKNWKTVLKIAKKSAKLHLEMKNHPAYLDMLFLQAEALFETDELAKAEKILRQIIEEDKKKSSCFQVANSYNLLGLIYLLRHDLKRAKTLFTQSMNCEIQNDRSLGLLIDYANLANVEGKIGNSKQALKYLKLAIGYAAELEESDLLRILEKRLTRLQASTKQAETLFPLACSN